MYILVDYLNFKHAGTSDLERYQNKGWGLLQVLLHMNNTGDVRQDFVTAAQEILLQRVSLSPKESNEAKWIKGWFKRLQTYL